MARLPTFTSDETLDTGGRQLRTIRPDRAIGSALQGLGRSLDSLAATESARRKADQAKLEAQENADENLGLDVAANDLQLELTREAERKQEELGDNPTGLGNHVEEFARKRIAELQSTTFKNHHNPARVEQVLRRAAQSRLQETSRIEIRGRAQYRLRQADAKLQILESSIAISPSNTPSALEEGDDYINNIVAAPEPVKAEMRQLFRRRLTRAHLRAVVESNPDKARDFAARLAKHAGGKSPKAMTFRNAGDKAVFDAATSAGIDPHALFAIGHIESRNQDDRGNPVINGRRASSAIGRFQVIAAAPTLKALGIKPEDRTDINKVAPAIASYFQRQQESLKAQGFRGDTAEVYMTWNIGPGPARALLRAEKSNPKQSFASVIVPILRRAGHGPRFIKQYLENNPAFYSASTPVGTVVSRYRSKINGAFKATGDLVEGGGGNLSDKVVQSSLAGFTTVDLSPLNAKDVGDILSSLLPQLRREATENIELLRGEAKANGAVQTSLGDKDDQRDINTYSKRLDFGPRIVEGDTEATTKARIMIEKAKFVPQDITTALVGAIDNGGEGSVRAYEFMADVLRKEPDAFRQTNMPAEIRKRIETFDAFIQGGLTMTPGQAVKIIEKAESERGKLNLKAVRETVKEELKWVDAKDVERKFNATVLDFASPQGLNESARGLLLQTYRQHYEARRSDGYSQEHADLFAVEQMRKIYGVSTVATDDRNQTLMPYPPEKFYRASSRNSHEWIRKQAQNFVASYFILGIEGTTEPPSQDEINKIEVRIIPTAQTADDIASDRSPSYMIAFKRPDGRIDAVPEQFTPNQDLMDTEDRIEFDAAAKKTRFRQEYFRVLRPGSFLDRKSKEVQDLGPSP